jgi:50S ribosomal subunit-associated GTPase HflX
MKVNELLRWVRRAGEAYPETQRKNIERNMNKLQDRRSKNKMAKQSRKRNRR